MIEHRLAPLPRPREAELHNMIRLLTFGELCAGQRAMLLHDRDVRAGLEVADPRALAPPLLRWDEARPS